MSLFLPMDASTMTPSVCFSFDDMAAEVPFQQASADTSSCWSCENPSLLLERFPSDEHFDDVPSVDLLGVDGSFMNIDERFCDSVYTALAGGDATSHADAQRDTWTDALNSDGTDTLSETDEDVRAEALVSAKCCFPGASNQLCQEAGQDDTKLDSSLSLSLVLQVKPRVRRRKFGKGDKHSLGGRPMHFVDEGFLTPIAVTPEALRANFDKPLHEAARRLGICATAVKKICRKMGIKEWPFQRIKPIRKRLAKLQSSTVTPDIMREMHNLQQQELALLEGHDLSCFNGA